MDEEGRSGRNLIAAFALGFEAGARVFLALGMIFDNVDGRMVPADTTGFGHAIIAGAAACGRMLGLDTPTMINAIGLGGMHTPEAKTLAAAVVAIWRHSGNLPATAIYSLDQRSCALVVALF